MSREHSEYATEVKRTLEEERLQMIEQLKML
jgi:hypothetical protein